MQREILESKGYKLVRTKTEYMECKFNSRRQRYKELVTIVGEEVTQIDQFCYLGLIMRNNGEIEENLTNRIKAGWLEWRSA